MRKVCNTCGTLYPQNYHSNACLICNEERQYVPEEGQIWTTREALSSTHKNKHIRINDRLFEIVIEPRFAIGQRAFLVLSERGNVLWDCVPMLDDETIRFINSKGGLNAIAFSHPHYYSNMNDWAKTFDCPIYIHQADAQHIVDKSEYISLWEGDEMPLWDDLKLVNIGGHFKGSSVLLISELSKRGVMLCGDTMYLSPSKRHFAIMYSYPNRMPLPISEIKRIKQRFDTLDFDSVYGFYSYQNVIGTAKEVLEASIKRYLE
jgi:hypothetical protein